MHRALLIVSTGILIALAAKPSGMAPTSIGRQSISRRRRKSNGSGIRREQMNPRCSLAIRRSPDPTSSVSGGFPEI